jgi:hypothetical protein
MGSIIISGIGGVKELPVGASFGEIRKTIIGVTTARKAGVEGKKSTADVACMECDEKRTNDFMNALTEVF